MRKLQTCQDMTVQMNNQVRQEKPKPEKAAEKLMESLDASVR